MIQPKHRPAAPTTKEAERPKTKKTILGGEVLVSLFFFVFFFPSLFWYSLVKTKKHMVFCFHQRIPKKLGKTKANQKTTVKPKVLLAGLVFRFFGLLAAPVRNAFSPRRLGL